MTTRYDTTSSSRLDAAGKSLQAALHYWARVAAKATPQVPPRVFVTVSRQPGAGGISFSHRLAERLNTGGVNDWSAWDRELVERVSSEYGVSAELIESIPDRHRSWLTTFLDAVSIHSPAPDFAELRAYKRVIMAIRALAERGHAVIVGQGGTFVTEKMPGAIHLRLVASLEHRIVHTSHREHIPLLEAAVRVADLDDHRAEFYRRFWQRKALNPEQFTMTLNAGEMSVDEMIEAVLPVIRMREAALVARNSQTPQRPAASTDAVERTCCHETAHSV